MARDLTPMWGLIVFQDRSVKGHGGVFMSGETKLRSDCVLWIDRTNRIITFKRTKGFVPKEFPSHKERIAYAFQKVCFGYRIQ